MRVRGGEAHPADPRDLGGAQEQLGEADPAPVAVHVLADQRHLADPDLRELGDLGEHLGERARDLAAAGVGHDAERADVVAALHHGDELGDLAARGLGVGAGEDVLLGVDPGRLDHPRPVLLDPVEDLGELGDRVRPEDEVQVGDLLQQLVLLLLGDAAADADQRAARDLHRAVAAERREHLVLGLLADRAGVEDDQVRLVHLLGRRVGLRRQRLAHPERVVDVHLAAEGVNEVALHRGVLRWGKRESSARRGRAGAARSARPRAPGSGRGSRRRSASRARGAGSS